MLLRILKLKGQNTAEYAILIGLVVAAIMGMQRYVQRGIHRRMKDEADAYSTTVKSDANWATIAPDTSAVNYQDHYEFTDLNAKQTRDTYESTTETMAEGGELSRSISETSRGAAGDYRQYDYTF